jgi:hypothetical protein
MRRWQKNYLEHCHPAFRLRNWECGSQLKGTGVSRAAAPESWESRETRRIWRARCGKDLSEPGQDGRLVVGRCMLESLLIEILIQHLLRECIVEKLQGALYFNVAARLDRDHCSSCQHFVRQARRQANTPLVRLPA